MSWNIICLIFYHSQTTLTSSWKGLILFFSRCYTYNSAAGPNENISIRNITQHYATEMNRALKKQTFSLKTVSNSVLILCVSAARLVAFIFASYNSKNSSIIMWSQNFKTDPAVSLLRTSNGQKSFAYRGACTWNSFESNTKMAPLINAFRFKLKINNVK